MAYATYDHSHSPRGSFLKRAFDFLCFLAEANPRLQQAARLQAMSDAELAKRGIARDEIVRHVFGDLYYI